MIDKIFDEVSARLAAFLTKLAGMIELACAINLAIKETSLIF